MFLFPTKKPRRFHYSSRYGNRQRMDFHAGLHTRYRQRTIVLLVLLLLLLVLLSLG